MFGIGAIAIKPPTWKSSGISPTSKLKSQLTAVITTLIISFALAVSGPVTAEVILYGTSTGFGTGEMGSGGGGGGTGPGNFSQFHRVDITTGVATEISMDIGFGGDVGGLAASSNNELFAGTGGRGPNTAGRSESPTLLFTIDPVTGLGNSAIGPLGIEFGPPDSAGLGPGAGDFDQFGSRRQNIAGWSFDPIIGNLYGMAARGSQLFVADTTTGLATRIGTPCDSPMIGMPGGFCRRGNAIAFDDVGVNNPLGTLFWANDVEIAELNPATGLIIGTPAALDFTPFGTPDEPDAPFRVVAMDFHPLTGELYTAIQQRQSMDSPPAKSTLAILDPLAGTFTIIGAIDSTGVKLDGIAFARVGTFTIIGTIDSTGVKLDGIAFTHPATIVDIDIKPGSDLNVVNPNSKGVIPVAILTTDTFDATTVDPSTVQFGPGETGIRHRSVHFEDVDDDGDLDLLLHFRTQETGITCGDTNASLSGATFSGQPISGTDAVKTVGCVL